MFSNMKLNQSIELIYHSVSVKEGKRVLPTQLIESYAA